MHLHMCACAHTLPMYVSKSVEYPGCRFRKYTMGSAPRKGRSCPGDKRRSEASYHILPRITRTHSVCAHCTRDYYTHYYTHGMLPLYMHNTHPYFPLKTLGKKCTLYMERHSILFVLTCTIFNS